MPILLAEDACTLEEFTSLALAAFAVLRELSGVDPNSEKHRDGQRVLDSLVARSFERRTSNGKEN